MLPALLLAPRGSDHVLDMCAAPGSKSIQLLELMEADARRGGVLVANDASLPRAISLTHRLASVNVASPLGIVTSLDGRWWPDRLLNGFRFDRVLCDVPCSGDGTLRKKHANTPSWSSQAAIDLHGTQTRLLRQALRQLSVDGICVYSTCSFNPLENEAVVAAALRGTNAKEFELIDPRTIAGHLFREERDDDPTIGLHAAEGLTDWIAPDGVDAESSMQPPSTHEDEAVLDAEALRRCVRLLPHVDNCGGFFVAVIKRVADSSAAAPKIDDAEGGDTVAAGEGGGKGGDASALQPLHPTSDEWREITSFYGLQPLENEYQMLWAPGRAAKREKLYLATSGAARLLGECWRPAMEASAKGAQRLNGRLHAVGVKAFERLKLTNVRSREAYSCTWRPCQQALPFILPRMSKRVLRTSNEAFFSRVLNDRGVRHAELLEASVDGLQTCSDDETGNVVPGGVVLTLTEDDGVALASVAAVLSPNKLQVWAPKEEIVGLLALLMPHEEEEQKVATRPSTSRTSAVTMMAHSPEELQLAAALVFPLLVYKAAAVVQRQALQWYLDVAIALATWALLVYAAG